MFKITVVLAAFAVSFSLAYDASPAIATQHQNTFRSFGNLGQISTYSKALDTPFSSVRKSDVRISNPGFAVASPYAHAAVASPYAHAAIAAPYAHAAIAAPYAHAAFPAYAHAPIAHAPIAHGPLIAPVAKAVAPAGLLGVAYSAAPAVAHMTYSNGLGLSYAW